MKEEKLLRSLELVDDTFVKEADPIAIRRKKKRSIYVVGSIAATVCIISTIFFLWLFLPYAEPSSNEKELPQYKGSEYYELIKKLDAYYTKQELGNYKNNFDKYFGGLFDQVNGHIKEEMVVPVPEAGVPTVDGEGPYYDVGADVPQKDSYQEITDNQTAGVTEADRIKRSDKYIYYLGYTSLYVYSILGEDSEKVGEYRLDTERYYAYPTEFFLSQDCKTVTLILPDTKESILHVIALDVTDPASIREKSHVRVSGVYQSSRIADGSLLIMTQYCIQKTPDFKEESTFLPQIDLGSEKKSVSADMIVYPEQISNTIYTVVVKLDQNTLEMKDSAAFLCYSSDIYVSKDHIFAIRPYTSRTEEDVKDEKNLRSKLVTTTDMTEICGIRYTGNEFEKIGSITVSGRVKDRFSLDEYQGILRVVTTTRTCQYQQNTYSSGNASSDEIIGVMQTNATNASLYCIDLNTMQVKAEVLAFAPPGERVQSVRFDGYTAYVCTSVEFSDPVFCFDLSDLDHITCKDTGNIAGYSTSLIQFKDGYVVGIGFSSSRMTLKVEVYKETADAVVPISSVEYDMVEFSQDYKSYYINRENGLIGLGIYSHYGTAGENSPGYLVFHFNGERIGEVLSAELYGNNEYKRGVYIDGYFYLFSNDLFAVHVIPGISETK